MDYLESQNGSQIGSQYSGFFKNSGGTQDDFNFSMVNADTPVKNNDNNNNEIQIKNSNQDSNQNISLEIIKEEDATPYKINQNITQQNKQAPLNSVQSDKIQKLSQQIDYLENETKKESQELIIPQNKTNSKVNFDNKNFKNNKSAIKINNEKIFPMTQELIKNIDTMILRTEKIMDSFKDEFCKFVDEHKKRFRNNSELFKKILVKEAEYVINDEENNKQIDIKMQSLFNEITNILSNFKKFK